MRSDIKPNCLKGGMLILIFQIIASEILSQSPHIYLPTQLIVVADNLNFRKEPNIKAKSLGQLQNGELLSLLEIVEDSMVKVYLLDYSNFWLKVKRITDGQIGYVFSKYVKPSESVYLNPQRADRISNGFWYGIFYEDGLLKIEEVKPHLDDSLYVSSSIVTDIDKHELLICSQKEIPTRTIKGKLFKNEKTIKIGMIKKVAGINDTQYSLACIGTVDLKPPILTRQNEEIIFLKTIIDGSNRFYSQQNLTKYFLKFGEIGYQILFAGDLNQDGIPELVISEGTTQFRALYYFRSNEEGELELMSCSGFWSDC